jgi:hypothetical protein
VTPVASGFNSSNRGGEWGAARSQLASMTTQTAALSAN